MHLCVGLHSFDGREAGWAPLQPALLWSLGTSPARREGDLPEYKSLALSHYTIMVPFSWLLKGFDVLKVPLNMEMLTLDGTWS